MTLAELEKALADPTPELIEELCKRVHDIQGECEGRKRCAEDISELVDCYEDNDKYKPEDCTVLEEGGSWKTCNQRYVPEPPDYTRPENFWPLLEELAKCDVVYEVDITIQRNNKGVRECFVRISTSLNGVLEVIVNIDIEHENPGIAVCLAYLKVKERDNEPADR